MSDIGNYYGSYESAKEYETQGDILHAALEFWLCYQYYEHGEFPPHADNKLGLEAFEKYNKYLKRLPYAPLSKTTFIKGCQCLKSLWLYKNKYNQRVVSSELQQKFNRGHVIGNLAQKLFPNGHDASSFDFELCLRTLDKRTPLMLSPLPYKLKQNLWLNQTDHFLGLDRVSIYEAAFSFDKTFAAVDILDIIHDKAIAYEVKSSYDVKDVYIHDCALQYYVMSHCTQLDDFFLIYPDEEYVQSLNLDLCDLTIHNCDINKLFKKKSIIEEVKSLQDYIIEHLKLIKPILTTIREPRQLMGEHCSSPYDCEFHQYCSEL